MILKRKSFRKVSNVNRKVGYYLFDVRETRKRKGTAVVDVGRVDGSLDRIEIEIFYVHFRFF